MIFSYYPGCTLRTKGKDLDMYARKAAEALGVTMEEIPDWQCCGAVYPMASDEIATKLSAVRALESAKESGQELLTLCSACHHVIKRVNDYIKNVGDISEIEGIKSVDFVYNSALDYEFCIMKKYVLPLLERKIYFIKLVGTDSIDLSIIKSFSRSSPKAKQSLMSLVVMYSGL